MILLGDCRETLTTIAADSVQACITSPPYYGLRDYGTGEWNGGDPECDHVSHQIRIGDGMVALGEKYRGGGHKAAATKDVCFRSLCEKCGAIRTDSQIGLEETPEKYVDSIVQVFREVRRVLKPDGTAWINLGDSYAGSGRGAAGNLGKKNNERHMEHKHKPTVGNGLKPKDLIGIPWMVAFALRADGWYLRQDIIWNKPNPMPESVKDRCTKAHEYIFLLSKKERYYFNAEAIQEPAIYAGDDRGSRTDKRRGTECNSMSGATGDTRNKRSVWTVTTKPYAEAHFATYPPDLIEPCVLASTRPNDIVLDPFSGSGTTGMVAYRHGREYIGCELNPEYIGLSDKRTTNVQVDMLTASGL